MTASSKPRAHTPRTSTPRTRCRVGDIVACGHGWPPYVVLSIERGNAVLGAYRGPGSVSAPAVTESTHAVRKWVLLGRCNPDPLTPGHDHRIIRPTKETPGHLSGIAIAVAVAQQSMPRVTWKGTPAARGIALHVDPRGSLGETVTVLWETGTVSNVAANDLELIPERNDP